MIKVAVCGACGRMGRRIIRTVTEQKDMKIVVAVDAPKTPSVGQDAGEIASIGKLGVRAVGAEKLAETLKQTKPDVLVDFTVAGAAVENVKAAAGAGAAVVVGTTGFSAEQKRELREIVTKAKIPAVVTPNLSVGINVLFKLAGEAGRLLKDYDVELVETHHRRKLDAPSGTALRVAQIVAEASGRDFEKIAKFGRPRGKLGERPPEEIGIHAVRAGDVAGEHVLIFAGPSERLELVHRAQSRQAFANGAVKAIRHVVTKGKPGEIQDMQDVIGLK
ncbi:MAG: 4-hydroxy-tetrahydrodipicolinate reductase [Candidatus Hadarchaeota archaeon]|nr:4-hydroxy-tetrahydrodipicolinate reductase [Candidatus Hadarchaeota archaeon]